MKTKTSIILLAVCQFFVGCKNTPPPKLELSLNNITISNNGAPSTVDLTSNVSWKIATALPAWLSVTPASGTGDAQLLLSGVPNTKYSRTSDITIVCSEQGVQLNASLRITQDLLHFTLNPTSVVLENDGKDVSLLLSTDALWSLGNHPDWATITPTSGEGNSVLQLSASTNEQKKERSGSITFTYYDSNVSINLVQNGNPLFNLPPNKPDLLFPLNNDFDVSTYPLFHWSCSDPDDDPLTFTLSISQDGANFREYGPYSDSSVYLNNELDSGTTYYYKIIASDGDGGVSESDTFCFTTLNRKVYADGEVVLFMDANKPKAVVLIFTGDGYLKQDCNVGGLFEQNVTEGVEALFSVEPYATYRDYFRVYFVVAHSIESGATQIDQSIYKQTAFGTSFDNSGTSMTTNTDKAFEYAQKVPEITEYGINNTTVFMMVNQDRYAGTCWMWPSGKSIAICPVSRKSGTTAYLNVVLHEGGGHGFGRLADEYITNQTAIPTSEVSSYRDYQERGMYLNVDFITDPQKILWSHFIGLPGYSRVGIYEGAALYRNGAYRSEETNCMINNLKYFSAACRELIVKRILTISGEGYSFEKFLERDDVRSPGNAESQMKSFDSNTFIPLAPPVVVWQD